MLRPRLLFIAGLVAFAALIAACGGGGGGSSALPPGGSTGSHAAATVKVFIPNGGNSPAARKPAYISPSTATIAIAVYTVGGATPSPTTPPVSVAIASSTDCTTVTGGTTCTIAVTVPVATAVVLQISEYDASGNLLAQSLIGPINTTLSTIPTQSVSIGGVPATIVLTPSGLSAGDDGQTHAIAFSVSAQDASGNTIIPPGAYPNPIALSISGDANGALSLSATTVASPGASNGATAVTLTYNSATAITTATIRATSGTISASAPFAPIVFSPTSLPSLSVGGSMQSVTVSEAGYAGAFTVPGSGSVATVTCIPANCTPTSASGSITVSVAPVGAGTEAVSVIDANGGFANIPITVTGSGGGGELVAPSYSIYEYPTQTNGTNYGITVGPDGQTLWFVDRANNELGAVTNPAGCSSSCPTISETPDPQPTTPVGLQAITTGSDGNLYYTGIQVGTDTGALFQATCTATPTIACSNANFYSNPRDVSDVVSAPDGNLYLATGAESTSYSDIWWMPIVGCCSSFGYDYISSGQPNVLTVDQSGSTAWFTDTGTGDIGFFPLPCNYCSVTEEPSGYAYGGGARHRPLPHPNVAPPKRRNLGGGGPFATPLNGIVAAPDGNLYIAEAGANRIDQLNPLVWDAPCSGTGCTFTPITLPNANALPQNLVVGPDGNVWFTDTTGYIGFIALNTCATGCKVYEYKVTNVNSPTLPSSPWGITAGPDGDIWFTDSSTNAIGKVVL